MAALYFRNPVGLETFGCFKRVCIIERNTNESTGANLNAKYVQSSNTRETVRSIYKVQCQNKESSENDQEASVLAARESSPNSPSEFKFHYPMTGHKHVVSKCKGFFI